MREATETIHHRFVPQDLSLLVAKGAPLLSLRLDSDLGKGESYGGRIGGQLEGERRQIDDQLSAAASQVDAQQRRLLDDLASLDREVSQYRRQIALNAQRIALAQRQVDERAPYVREGVVSRVDADKLEDNLLSQQQVKETLAQELLAKEHRAEALRRELAMVPETRKAALAALRERQFALDQRITQTTRQSRVVLSAPLSGRVAGVHRLAGESSKKGAVLVDILPSEGRLQVELYAPTRAVGVVAPGAEVRLRYDAFPYQKFGVGRGQVVSVSEAAIDGRSLPKSVAADEPVYRIIVALESDHVLVDGRSRPLRSGMTLRADLIVELRSVGEHLFAPVLGVFKRG